MIFRVLKNNTSFRFDTFGMIFQCVIPLREDRPKNLNFLIP